MQFNNNKILYKISKGRKLPASCISFLQQYHMSLIYIQAHLSFDQYDMHDQHFGYPYCQNKDYKFKLSLTNQILYKMKLRRNQYFQRPSYFYTPYQHSTNINLNKKHDVKDHFRKAPWVPSRIHHNYTISSCKCQAQTTNLRCQQKYWSSVTFLEILKLKL